MSLAILILEKEMNIPATRLALSAISGGLYAALDKLTINSAAIYSGETSVSQLQDINQPVQQTLTQFASGAHISEAALLIALGAIWAKPIVNLGLA